MVTCLTAAERDQNEAVISGLSLSLMAPSTALLPPATSFDNLYSTQKKKEEFVIDGKTTEK